ncbi:MAG TPA: RES family NAD+ phosphorylase [Oscillatoriaceae cyanobacterium M33_DOE_052]|nr:RES family NAD+ phosphorylase [Oscillatoriaceae cyanobacterium M33_DOE_052]
MKRDNQADFTFNLDLSVLKNQELVTAISGLTTQSAQGVVFRYVHIKYQNSPLSAIGSLKAGGRYNIAGLFAALYTSDTPITALRELRVLVETAAGLIASKAPPYLLLSIEYSLGTIIDLTQSDQQNLLGTNMQELTGTWLPLVLKGQAPPTQTLGEAIYNAQNIEAIKVPSAHDPNAYNLVILPDRLSAQSIVKIYDPSGTINAQIP